VVAHAVAILGRRQAWSLPRTALVSALGFDVLSPWLLYLHTTFAGIPTSATFTTARHDLTEAWSLFRDVVAPAPVETGFLLASCFAIWLVAYLADWAAFRLWSSFEAIVPAGTLFVFASMINTDQPQLPATIAFLVAALAFLLLHRVLKQESSTGWLGAEAADGRSSMLRSGAALGAAAVLVAVLVGPALPGAEDSGVIDWRQGDNGPGSRVTLSPMVDIRKRLVEQSDQEVFTVRSSERSYWRLTSLDTFDGSIWKSKGDYDEADGGELPRSVPSSARGVDVSQSFTIEALAALWLPAAYEPRAVDTEGVKVVYEAASATLIVGSDLPTSDGLRYEVTSSLPRFDPETLAEVPEADPAVVGTRYLELPPDFSETARTTAEQVTASAPGPYYRALALQNFFRENFQYSQDVRAGHNVDAIDEFLATRTGYCEQFAGTYAAMARSVGLPARVAVGFIPGTLDPEDDELYHVRGKDAHAWPEVYFEGLGWVPFEPTVDRGIPNAESYTGVPEPAVDDSAPGGATTSTTVSPADDATSGTTLPPPDLEADDFAGAIETGDEPSDPGTPWYGRALIGLAVLVAVALLYVAVIVSLKRYRRSQRRRAAHAPPDDGSTDRRTRPSIALAWAEAVEALDVARLRQRPDETQAELMRRLPERWALPRSMLDAFAAAAAAATYGAAEPSDAQADAAEQGSAAIEAAVRAHTTRGRRVTALLDPRALLPHRRARVVSDRTTVQARSV
jgi:transglutaminase-like putative cysteine protease